MTPSAEKAPLNPLVAEGGVKIEGQTPRQEVAFVPSGRDSGNVVISQGSSRFSSRSISDTGPKYTGKRISLNFKDADLKDVFRLFHEITGFNIVLDPAVAGTLTIVLENVPEDQALDIILKNNGLDKVFENNVIRIASSQKLASEAAARKALIEAQQLEEEPVTFTRSLSYAKANDVMPIVKKIMSKRGDAIMDNRTNTLIITDLRDRQDPINRLIDTLDEQTPQVVIEARIVETDRLFERDLGILWGAAKQTTIRGKQTDLTYDVDLHTTSSGTFNIAYGSVLDTFQLNATLDAFELNGDVKVLSSPRIAAQNNQKAVLGVFEAGGAAPDHEGGDGHHGRQSGQLVSGLQQPRRGRAAHHHRARRHPDPGVRRRHRRNRRHIQAEQFREPDLRTGAFEGPGAWLAVQE